MADIAMLVAEEYERRVKNSRYGGEEMELVSCVGVLKGYSSSWIKGKLRMEGEKMVEVLVNGVLDPKSQMSLAASNGFFSA
ncbi:hypothetical protein Pfo_018693 [Paulownia fortunei]|nr:hypothetical protein Pfo_018693 [Paulownia fortunei]